LIAGILIVGCQCLQVAVADPPAPIQPSTISQPSTVGLPPAPVPAGQNSAQLTPPAASSADSASAAVAPSTDHKPAAPLADGAATSASNPLTDAQVKKYRSKGYKPVVHDGTTVFCRSEATLGSRLERQVCRTAEQLDEAAQASQDLTRDVQRGGTLSNRAPGN
jgi:hypothetical protein